MIKVFDIHCHFLPGVDDGAKDMDETYRMLSIAYREGIRTMIATPHYRTGDENIPMGKLEELMQEVKEISEANSMEFQFLLGHELMYSSDIVRALEYKEALTLNGTRYILLEFIPDTVYQELRFGLNQCIYAGYIPILAHAERYLELIRKPKRVKDLIDLGVYIQINTSSIRKWFSKRTRFCHKLLKHDWVHFIGTDAHGAEVRVPCAKHAVNILRKKYGEDTVKRLLWENPMTMLENRYLY